MFLSATFPQHSNFILCEQLYLDTEHLSHKMLTLTKWMGITIFLFVFVVVFICWCLHPPWLYSLNYLAARKSSNFLMKRKQHMLVQRCQVRWSADFVPDSSSLILAIDRATGTKGYWFFTAEDPIFHSHTLSLCCFFKYFGKCMKKW